MTSAAKLASKRAANGGVPPENNSVGDALYGTLNNQSFVIRPDEAREFNQLCSGLRSEVNPQGMLEWLAFERLFHAAWSIRRFRRIECEAGGGTLADFTDPQTAAVLDRLTRYQVRAQRAYAHALAEIQALQTTRAQREAKLTPEEDDAVPLLAAIDEMTKQSQSDVTAQAVDLAAKLVGIEANSLRLGTLRSSTAGAGKARPMPPAQLTSARL